MSTDTRFEQRNPGESNPAEMFCVINQRPMWLPLLAVQNFTVFQQEAAKQAGTAAVPTAGEKATVVKHAALHGVTMV